jgi:carbamate kinase
MADHPLVVVALGGHSLVEEKHRKQTPVTWLRKAGGPTKHIASYVAQNPRTLICHGNGPQVGASLIRSEVASKVVEPVPLAGCVAETQGTLGLSISLKLEEALAEAGRPELRVVSVVTRVVVDPNDPAFDRATKPIGPVLDEETARHHEKEDGWEIVEDKGRGLRRVVASPHPREIVELDAIRTLIDAGFVTVAGGGGGVPVIRKEDEMSGVPAVIDKDRTSALLGEKLGADGLVILTSIEGVMRNFGTPDQELLREVSVEDARKLIDSG